MLVQCEWAAKRQRNSYYLGEFHRLHKATVGSAASAASSSTSAAEQTTLIGMPAPPTVAEHLPGSPHKELAGARLQGGSYQSDASDQRSSIDRASEPVLPHVAIGGTVVPCSRCLNAGEFSDHRGRFSSASWTTLRQWMMADVLWKDRRHRLPSPHQRRHRRPAWGNGVVSLRLRPAVTFLSGRSCDFAIGDRHRQLNGGATDCAA